MGRRKIRNVRSSGNNNNSVAGVNNSNNNNSVAGATDEVIYSPTRNVVNTTTNERTIKRVHPTQVENVNRTIVRNENYYPVTESDVNETVVENYDCGSDINNPNCRRVGGRRKGKCG
ncbi:CotD family spore coat protein [Ornithinibacillus salinisoli]|uniref:CotD family spore coat protein n=1 Tax=Ornithinibacillus salinisoli TaxID=1848459 RepID=A0ABW4W4I7_9BACI